MKHVVGFTLIELALALAVMSLLLGGLITPLVGAREYMNRTVTQQQLQRIETALIGHLLTLNRFPCAASKESAGREQVASHGCLLYAGFLPSSTLGIMGPTNEDGLLIDQWGRPFLYRISASDSNLDGSADYAVTSGVTLQVPLEVRADNVIALAVDGACGERVARAEAVVVVVASQGKQSARSPAEGENTDGDATFVSRPTSDVAGCAFDDQLLWLTENQVLTLLLQAGALPRPE